MARRARWRSVRLGDIGSQASRRGVGRAPSLNRLSAPDPAPSSTARKEHSAWRFLASGRSCSSTDGDPSARKRTSATLNAQPDGRSDATEIPEPARNAKRDRSPNGKRRRRATIVVSTSSIPRSFSRPAQTARATRFATRPNSQERPVVPAAGIINACATTTSNEQPNWGILVVDRAHLRRPGCD